MGYDLFVFQVAGIEFVNGTSVATGDKVSITIHGHWSFGCWNDPVVFHIDGALPLLNKRLA